MSVLPASTVHNHSPQRLAPWVQSAQPVIHDVINKTAEINSALGARAQTTLQSSTEISHHLIDQLKILIAHGKEVPGHLIEVSCSV